MRVKDMVIRPACLPVSGQDATSLVSYKFPLSGGTYEGQPLILDGIWDLDSVRFMADRKILVPHMTFDADFYREDAARYAVAVVNTHNLVDFRDMHDRLPNPSVVRFLKLDLAGLSREAMVDFINDVRTDFPGAVLIAGPVLDETTAFLLRNWGADLVEVTNRIVGDCGVEVDEVALLRLGHEMDILSAMILDEVDMVKSLALGASFVTITGGTDENALIEKIRLACLYTEMKDPSELWKASVERART